MEGNKIPMSSNISLTVGNGSIDSTERNPQVYEVGVTDSSLKEEQSLESKQTLANRILDSAKEEGFEMTLINLANGEFQELPGADDNVGLEVEENSEPGSNSDTGEDEGDNLQNENEPAKDVEDESLEAPPQAVERIRDLEERIKVVEEQNRTLFEKLEKEKGNNAKALQTMHEMTLVMMELLKDEKDDEAKVPMLERLLQIMLTLMNAMFMPEDSRGVQKTMESQTSQSITREKAKKRSIEEVVKDLRRSGKIRSERQMRDDSSDKIAQAA